MPKLLNAARNRAGVWVATASTVVAASMVSAPAMAAVDAAITTELATVKTDMLTVGGLIIALAAAALGIRWVKATFF